MFFHHSKNILENLIEDYEQHLFPNNTILHYFPWHVSFPSFNTNEIVNNKTINKIVIKSVDKTLENQTITLIRRVNILKTNVNLDNGWVKTFKSSFIVIVTTINLNKCLLKSVFFFIFPSPHTYCL